MASHAKTTKDKRRVKEEKIAKKRVRKTRRKLMKLKAEGRLAKGV